MGALTKTLAAGLKALHPDLPDADRARLARLVESHLAPDPERSDP